MVDCVKTLTSAQHPTSALLQVPASTMVGHITATVAEASSWITPSAMTRMSVWKAAAARTQPAQIHLAPSLVSVEQGTGEMASLVWMWTSARWLSSATPLPFALTSLAPTNAPVRWVILETGWSNAAMWTSVWWIMEVAETKLHVSTTRVPSLAFASQASSW